MVRNIRIAMPGFSETLTASQGETVAVLVEKAVQARGTRLPPNVMFFLNGQRVDADTVLAEIEDAIITVASQAKNG